MVGTIPDPVGYRDNAPWRLRAKSIFAPSAIHLAGCCLGGLVLGGLALAMNQLVADPTAEREFQRYALVAVVGVLLLVLLARMLARVTGVAQRFPRLWSQRFAFGSRWQVPLSWARLGRNRASLVWGIGLGVGFTTPIYSFGFVVAAATSVLYLQSPLMILLLPAVFGATRGLLVFFLVVGGSSVSAMGAEGLWTSSTFARSTADFLVTAMCSIAIAMAAIGGS